MSIQTLKSTSLLVGLTCALGLATPVHAAVTWSDGTPADASIIVNGTGEVQVEPDQATIHLNAVGNADSAVLAQEQMQELLRRMMARLAELGYDEDEIRSRATSITPRWNWIGNARELDGYEARTTVEVSVSDLDRIATTLQGLLAAGIDQINGITYGSTQLQDAYADALRQAVADAVWKGELFVQGTERSSVRVIRIEELSNSGPVVPMDRSVMAMAVRGEAGYADVQPDAITVEARVRVALGAE